VIGNGANGANERQKKSAKFCTYLSYFHSARQNNRQSLSLLCQKTFNLSEKHSHLSINSSDFLSTFQKNTQLFKTAFNRCPACQMPELSMSLFRWNVAALGPSWPINGLTWATNEPGVPDKKGTKRAIRFGGIRSSGSIIGSIAFLGTIDCYFVVL
jgi:hypothetical protein